MRNVSTVWLGSTVGCAECHDHKYRSVHVSRFLQLGGVLRRRQGNCGRRAGADPISLARTGRRALRKLTERRDDLKSASGDSASEQRALEQKIDALLQEIPTSLVSESVPPRITRILPRGNWLDDSGPIVIPQVPAFLGSVGSKQPRASRLDLAKWLVDANNPLVAA